MRSATTRSLVLFLSVVFCGCAGATDDPAVGVEAAALSGTTLFGDAFGAGTLARWPTRSSAWTATSTVSSASTYALLPDRSGAPVARVGACRGTCTLQSAAIDLAGAAAVSLELSISSTLSSTADYVGVRVYDGSTWRDFGAPWTSATGTTSWRRVAVDLSAFGGVRNFRFALYGRSLESGDSAQLDDVALIAAFSSVCGDGVRAGNEACDGADLGGNTCVGLGFNGGSLGCSASCTLDTSQCSDQTPDGIDCRNPTTWPAAWTQFEDQVLVLVNQRRAAGATCGATPYPAVAAVVSNEKLREAARCHSLDMATQSYFSHNGLDGSDPGSRIAAAGYHATAWGENIAAGYRTPQQVVDGWMSSPGHCTNIMSRNYQHVGNGYAFDEASTYQDYWTQEFGSGN